MHIFFSRKSAERTVSIGKIFHEPEYNARITRGLDKAIRNIAKRIPGKIVIGIEQALIPEYVGLNILALQSPTRFRAFSPREAYYFAATLGPDQFVTDQSINPNNPSIQAAIVEQQSAALSDGGNGSFIDSVLTTLDALNRDPHLQRDGQGRIVFLTEDFNTKQHSIDSRELTFATIDAMYTQSAQHIIDGDWEAGRLVMLNAAYTLNRLNSDRNNRIGTILLDVMDISNAKGAIILTGAAHEKGITDAIQVISAERKSRRGSYPNVAINETNVFGQSLSLAYTDLLVNAANPGQSVPEMLIKQALIENTILSVCQERLLSNVFYDKKKLREDITRIVKGVKTETDAEKLFNEIGQQGLEATLQKQLKRRNFNIHDFINNYRLS